MSKHIVSNVERSFIDNILHGDDTVKAVITSAKRLASTELRVLGRSVGITAAMCGDGTDIDSIVFAAKSSGGKRWESFQQLVTAAATQHTN